MSQIVPEGGGSGAERYLPTPDNDWKVIYDNNNEGTGSNFSRIVDSSAPQSPPYVWQLRQQAGTYGGGVPGSGEGKGWGNLNHLLPHAQGYYLSVWIKWSANYYGQPVSHKWLFNELPGGGFYIQYNHQNHFLRASDEAIQTPYEPQVGTRPTLGEWHHVEAVVIRGKPGIVKIWLDGQLRTDYADLPVATTARYFTALSISGHIGGGGYVLPEDQFYWMDHIFIATP